MPKVRWAQLRCEPGMLMTLGNWAGATAQDRLVDRYLPVSTAVAHGNQLEGRQVPFTVLPNFVPDDVVTALTPTMRPRKPARRAVLAVCRRSY